MFMLSRLRRATVLLLVAPIAFASEENRNELDTVIVTATRTARTADETLTPVTVISRKEIERSQAQSVADLLAGQPGIALANNGGQGKTTSVYLRGTNADHVLVLVDGVKIGSATTGMASFQDLPLEMIERIEIVRGPRSSLYGSEAIGGVIQIFTRKGSGSPSPSFSIGSGSYGTWQESASLSGGVGKGGWYSLGLSAIDSRGFNACNGKPGAGCYTFEPDRDGYRNRSGRLRAGWRFDNGTDIEVNWLRAQGTNQYDGDSNESKSVQQVLGASLGFTLADLWRSSLRVSQSNDDSDNFKNGAFKYRFNTRRDQISWQNDLSLASGHLLVAGADWQNERIDSSIAYPVTSRDNTGLFVQYLVQLVGHDLQFSVRRDDNQQFGGKTTGGVAWGYRLASDLRLTASYGTAFKAPTFNQLYYPGFGNASLRPEQSRSLDIGLAGQSGKSRWSLNAFETRVKDLIGFDASYIPVNIDSARIRGVEAVGAIHWLDWDLRGSLSLLDPENQAEGANNGKVLPRRARQSFAFNGDRDFGAWRAGATLRGAGRRYDDLANTIALDAYATLDLRAEYRLNPDWRLQARLENLFDKHYETAYLFNQPGRSVWLTLRYQP
ncbi:MAG TPA: TonB-dependent vitamin B12 receptor, partial [Accumulibacter sp.]|nr:TonB-dependent vitamin B12 receptor [Accumulibacter sp.]